MEGQLVKQGEPIARLLDADARIELGEAQADFAIRVAEVEAAQAELNSARIAAGEPDSTKSGIGDRRVCVSAT